jgi:hypothetical protein
MTLKDADSGRKHFLHNGLPLHREKIYGTNVLQLVYRSRDLQLTHNSIFGNHLGTKDKIKLTPLVYLEILKITAEHVNNISCKVHNDRQIKFP